MECACSWGLLVSLFPFWIDFIVICLVAEKQDEEKRKKKWQLIFSMFWFSYWNDQLNYMLYNYFTQLIWVYHFLWVNKKCENLMFSTFSFQFWANKETIMWIFLFGLVVLVCNKLWLCFCLKQLEQCGLRTPQCTIQGSLDKPEDRMALKVRFMSIFSDGLWSWYNWIIWMMYLKECCIIC